MNKEEIKRLYQFNNFLRLRTEHNKRSCSCRYIPKQLKDKGEICVDCFAYSELSFILREWDRIFSKLENVYA